MNRKLGVGVLGTGWVSGEHIKAFQQNPHTEVTALLSRDRSRAEAKAREFNLGHCRTKRWPGQTSWATVPAILPDTAEVSHHPFAGQMNHFVECILLDRESHCNVADAVKTHEICLAAEISTREGRPVYLPL